ncbi:dihydrolipoyl dehydrogenase family protein [Kineococcus sp. R86509]|uniref:dihydrolipoyl dehydrogenase family protein n=1 Tax=Kineococcus sp. R86509 TaxID=3093851 RepID=UPI0036D3F048
MFTSQADVCVIGSGSGGKMVAQRLARAGRRVVLVERGYVGGFCPYVACVPAKSLLLSAAAGLSWPAARALRDEAVGGRDDSGAARGLTDDGVEIVRGTARLDGPGRVLVEDGPTTPARITARTVVIGTGSSPVRPELPVDVATWTSEEALAADELPARLAIVGGGPVACELAQAYAGLGSRVTMLVRGEHLLSGEPSWVGEALADVLRGDGVDVRTSTSLDALADLDVDRVLLGTGRTPATSGLGLDEDWLTSAGAVRTDGRCRVVDASGSPVEGLFAVGDVTGISPYTHTANHQARTVVDELLGRGRDADYSAIPRAVYTHPPVFSTGDTSGDGARSARFSVTEVERANLLELSAPRDQRRALTGAVELFARDGILVGAACLGPEADSWGAELSLAVRARLTVDLLAHHVRAFPTWSEAVFPALEELQG